MRCCGPLVSEFGYNCCTNCGRVLQLALDTDNCSYDHTPRSLVVRPYSRKSRFFGKCLGLLRCIVNYKIDEKLLRFLKKRKPKTPESLFTEIGRFPTKKRRPFDCIMFYWRALGNPQPICTDRDIQMLKHDFDEIHFAWTRLGFKNPRFPYSFLFRKIVNSSSKFSPGMVELTRFVRKLRCEHRRSRYEILFKECLDFDYKTMDHVPIPETGLPKSTIVREKNNDVKKLNVYDVKNVYRSKQEMDRAIENGTFDVAKTMHIDKNGRFYVLSFEDPVRVQNVQVQDNEKEQLSPTSKLGALLRAQSMLP